ncbi:MAG: hypothetical protein ACKO0V_01160, partial [bacterium]
MSQPESHHTDLHDKPSAGMGCLLWTGVCFSVITGCLALASKTIPAGVPGEWVWQKPRTTASVNEWLWAAFAVVSFIAVQRALARLVLSRKTRSLAVVLLFPAAALVQAGLQKAAPDSYGLAKWPLCTYFEGSSGYFAVAVEQVNSLNSFLNNYPTWIKSQDCLHIGTHPPGLIFEARLWLDFWENRPDEAKKFLAMIPIELRDAARSAAPGKNLPIYQQAALISISMTHWLMCAMAVWPIYYLVRRLEFEPEIAFSVASFWPVLSSAIMFQPASDVAFAMLGTTAIALSINSNQIPCRYYLQSGLSGLVMALGMFLSLVFLPVGLIVAILLLTDFKLDLKKRMFRILATGVGFLTGIAIWAFFSKTNPIAIWLANMQNHGRFYVEYPRSYIKWIIADAGEVAFGIGLPVFFLITLIIYLVLKNRKEIKPREMMPMGITLVIMFFLAISGKSLSEVSRLWLPFFPILLSGIAVVLKKYNSRYFVS